MNIYNKVNLTKQKISSYSLIATDFANGHGIVMKNSKHPKLTNYAPFMLFPSPIPKYLYNEVMDVQKHFHSLVHKASQDHEFITESLKSCMIHDAFTKRLYEIYEKVHRKGIIPRFYFNIIRSDYMIDETKTSKQMNGHATEDTRLYEMKQIEINMIASSFGGLGTLVGKMHRYMADMMDQDCPYSKDQLTDSNTLQKLGEGMAKVWELYNCKEAVVIFVVHTNETNRFDQKLLEYSFQDCLLKHGFKKMVPVWFCSLSYIYRNGEVKDGGVLCVDGREIALCYFRTGYSPDSYADEDSWKGRELIEMSTVPKCPTIAEQLIGTKKIQQVFAMPGMVERFIGDEEAVMKIRRTFAGLFSLDPGPDGEAAVEMAISSPSRYVLKPQREGGGNNFYDEDMVKELKSITDPLVRSQYILMERIEPPVVPNYIVHIDYEHPRKCDTISELGIFGIFISEGEHEIFNDSVGHLLRTKDIQFKDGGVASGRAVLDSPYLI